MGINCDTMEFFFASLKAVGITSLKDVWLLELGNQCIRQNVKDKYHIKTGKSKAYFLSKRCHHHSIDWNGRDGAIPLDLTEPIPIKRFMDAFSIITDFGDMEHVRGGATGYAETWLPGEGHWQAWKNLHDMGKVGCVYMHTLPAVGAFRNHGSYHYTIEFFENMIKANGYEVLEIRSNQCDPRTMTREYVFCSYVKRNDNPFAPEWDEFKEWLHR